LSQGGYGVFGFVVGGWLSRVGRRTSAAGTCPIDGERGTQAMRLSIGLRGDDVSLPLAPDRSSLKAGCLLQALVIGRGDRRGVDLAVTIRDSILESGGTSDTRAVAPVSERYSSLIVTRSTREKM
jgi:hypothetical protein